MPIPLEGPHIRLRFPESKDAASLAHHAHDKEIARWTFIPYPYDITDARKFLRLSKTARRKGTALHLLIEDIATGEAIGMVGLDGISKKYNRGEVGYWLSRHYRKQGIMSEALGLALKFYFNELKLHRVVAHVFEGNTDSMLLLERMGFVQEGCLRKHVLRRKRWTNLHIYGIQRDEFKPSQLPV